MIDASESAENAESPSTLKDVRLLFATRILRMFAYGSLTVILVLYLHAVGLGDGQIGLLLTMTLLGDTALSLLITTTADRIGRKRMLIAGAALMTLGGVGFACTAEFVWLLAAATVGVISPTGTEVGPFLAIEQAALAQEVVAEHRTRLFAWYHLAGAFATAAGAGGCGLVLRWLENHGVSDLYGYRAVLFAYAAVGVLLAVLFTRLSAGSEAVQLGRSERSAPRRYFGLHRSRKVVAQLSALFALDSFAGGFVIQSVMAFWFHAKFHADLATLGGIFFGANVLAGASALAAPLIARRVGLINTMVWTHAPSNVMLALVPFMPTLPLAVTLLLVRFAISQMDVPTRQSYTAAVVDPTERSAAAGITGIARTTGTALAPVLTGLLLGNPRWAGVPFVIAGVLKLVYDGLLYIQFRTLLPPEEIAKDGFEGMKPG